MIDWENETPVRLRDIDQLLRGGPVSESTKFRWDRKGVRGVRLSTYLQGGIRMTTVEAVRRFINELSAVADGTEGSADLKKNEEAVSREQEKVNAELRRRGC